MKKAIEDLEIYENIFINDYYENIIHLSKDKETYVLIDKNDRILIVVEVNDNGKGIINKIIVTTAPDSLQERLSLQRTEIMDTLTSLRMTLRLSFNDMSMITSVNIKEYIDKYITQQSFMLFDRTTIDLLFEQMLHLQGLLNTIDKRIKHIKNKGKK